MKLNIYIKGFEVCLSEVHEKAAKVGGCDKARTKKLLKAQMDIYTSVFLPELKQAKRRERNARKYAKRYAMRK